MKERNAKFKNLPFCQKLILDIKLLHTNAQCVHIVNTKTQIPAVKALVKVKSPVHALFEQSRPIWRRKQLKTMLSSKAVISSKIIFFYASNFFIQMSNVSAVCIQSSRCQQQRLWYQLNSQCRYSLRTRNPYEEEK